MPIQRLEITGVRNITSARLALNPKVNIFFGDNGSGKTSLLEAVYLTGRARSFRSSKINPIINNNLSECTVFALIDTATKKIPVGVTRARNGRHSIRVSGEIAHSTSALAELQPMQVVNSDTFQLLEGSPKQRRQFIDWGVFHVEHSFLEVWQFCKKSLQQRNALLRANVLDKAQINVWEERFAHYSHQIDQYRREYLDRLGPHFNRVINKLNGNLSQVRLHYSRGWQEGVGLGELLQRNRIIDKNHGFTNIGPHRADLKIQLDSELATDILSRGQQKLVIYAMRIAQGSLLAEETGKLCVYLLDDLPSELDSQHQRKLSELFEEIGAQVLITTVEKEPLIEKWTNRSDVSMFHVKHGVVEQESLPLSMEIINGARDE